MQTHVLLGDTLHPTHSTRPLREKIRRGSLSKLQPAIPTGLAVCYPLETGQRQSSASGSDCVPLKTTKEEPWSLQCVAVAGRQRVLEYIRSAIT